MTLCKAFNEPLQFESENLKLVSMLLSVSVFKSDNEFKIGVRDLMERMFNQTSKDVAVRSVMNYFNTHCKDKILNKISRLGLIPRKLNE